MIYECVSCYIHKNNYSGLYGCGEGIFTLTQGMSQASVADMRERLRVTPNPALMQYNSEEGARSLPVSKNTYDRDIRSFYYGPRNKSGLAVFSHTCLRRSMVDHWAEGKEYNLKRIGTPEVTHSLVFDRLSIDTYAVDLMGCGFFTDISLVNEDTLEEEKPGFLSPFDESGIRRESVDDLLNSLGDGALEQALQILQGLRGTEMKKPLYLTIPPGNHESAEKLIRAAIKLLPVEFANTISFSTCSCSVPLSMAEGAQCNICVVPTDDENGLIRTLEERGTVIRMLNEIPCFDEMFTQFKCLLERGCSAWCEFIKDYPSDFVSIDDIGRYMGLSNCRSPLAVGSTGATVDELRRRLDVLVNSIRILKNPGCFICPLTKGFRDIQEGFENVSRDNALALVNSLARLFDMSGQLGEDIRNTILTCLRYMLFGCGSNVSSANVDLLFNADVVKENCYQPAVDSFVSDSKSVEDFVNGASRFNSGYVDKVCELLLFGKSRVTDSISRDRLVNLFMQSTDIKKFEKILEGLCDGEPFDRVYSSVLFFIRNRVNQEDERRALLKSLFDYLHKRGDKGVIDHLFAHHWNDLGMSDVDRDIFTAYLGSVSSPLGIGSNLKDALDSYDLLTGLSDHEAFISFATEYYLVEVVGGNLGGVETSTDLYDFSYDPIGRAERMMADLESRQEYLNPRRYDEITSTLSRLLLKLKENHGNVQRSTQLKDFRIDFVLSEFCLLENKVMMNLLDIYTRKGFRYNVKAPDFLEQAVAGAREFLNDPSRSGKEKAEFCADVRQFRKSAKDYRSREERGRRTGGSLLFRLR